jgi:hypothetical protein
VAAWWVRHRIIEEVESMTDADLDRLANDLVAEAQDHHRGAAT